MKSGFIFLTDLAVFVTWIIVVSIVFERLGARDTNEFYIIFFAGMAFRWAGMITSSLRNYWE